MLFSENSHLKNIKPHKQIREKFKVLKPFLSTLQRVNKRIKKNANKMTKYKLVFVYVFLQSNEQVLAKIRTNYSHNSFVLNIFIGLKNPIEDDVPSLFSSSCIINRVHINHNIEADPTYKLQMHNYTYCIRLEMSNERTEVKL